MDDQVAQMQSMLDAMFPKVLGMKLTEVTPDRIKADLTVTPDICTTGNILHGGAAMTMADFMGAAGTFLNLPPGAGTTTLESKTNFIGSATVGQRIEATCEPVHKGKSTQVWRTTIKRDGGKAVAVVTQTQMVLAGPPSNQELLASLFQGKPLAEQKALLAQLERAGAGLYRAFAAQETDEARQAELLRAAEKEEENARTLEKHA
ncbi:MAG TPA: PaaI family thioesterase [Dehalococcoidia bacterium]|nr:PaaI family thioesterase [Dehalococcoidia bacterium]